MVTSSPPFNGYDPCVRSIFAKSCNQVGCHAGPDAAFPNLEDASLAQPERFVGVVSQGEGSWCAYKHPLLIDPDQPMNSLMYTKLDRATLTCDAIMALVGGNLTAAEKQCVLDWIKSYLTH